MPYKKTGKLQDLPIREEAEEYATITEVVG